MRIRWKRLSTLFLALAIGLSSLNAQAQVTNFSSDVGTAIDDGLDWLDANGAFNNPSSAGNAVGLTLLALLDKRESTDITAVSQGYANASAADQARMRTTVEYILGQINLQGASFYAYRDGAYLMALSVYMRSGGPEIAGAPLTLIEAINAVFDRTAANQGAAGYWCYFNGLCPDSSTTQLVMAGLAAVKGVYSDPLYEDAARLASVNTLAANARAAYVLNGSPGQVGLVPGGIMHPDERGHGYNAGNENTVQQTGSGIWIQLVGGADLNDPSVQGYLRWMYNRYVYSGYGASGTGSFWPSYYYYLWSSSKAYNFLASSGVAPAPGNLTPDDLGTLPPGDAPALPVRQLHRDPATDVRVARFGAGGAGYYADEPQNWYYDYAYSLLDAQQANGFFPGAESRWDTWAAQAYAILVLQRSVGGGCIDTDGDGVCDEDDNCPLTPNADQADRDQDGVGDVCDNCVDVFNPGQEDSDGNGIGDACSVQVMKCDMDGDGDIDRNDINVVFGLRGTTSPPSDPLADVDDNGIININDGRGCVLRCDLPRCASPPQ
jgi:hypothetical protein